MGDLFERVQINAPAEEPDCILAADDYDFVHTCGDGVLRVYAEGNLLVSEFRTVQPHVRKLVYVENGDSIIALESETAFSPVTTVRVYYHWLENYEGSVLPAGVVGSSVAHRSHGSAGATAKQEKEKDIERQDSPGVGAFGRKSRFKPSSSKSPSLSTGDASPSPSGLSSSTPILAPGVVHAFSVRTSSADSPTTFSYCPLSSLLALPCQNVVFFFWIETFPRSPTLLYKYATPLRIRTLFLYGTILAYAGGSEVYVVSMGVENEDSPSGGSSVEELMRWCRMPTGTVTSSVDSVELLFTPQGTLADENGFDSLLMPIESVTAEGEMYKRYFECFSHDELIRSALMQLRMTGVPWQQPDGPLAPQQISVTVLFHGSYAAQLTIHSLMLIPEYTENVPAHSGPIANGADPYLTTMKVLVAHEKKGFLYDISSQNCLATYIFTAPAFSVVRNDALFFVATESGLEAWSIRSEWAEQLTGVTSTPLLRWMERMLGVSAITASVSKLLLLSKFHEDDRISFPTGGKLGGKSSSATPSTTSATAGSGARKTAPSEIHRSGEAKSIVSSEARSTAGSVDGKTDLDDETSVVDGKDVSLTAQSWNIYTFLLHPVGVYSSGLLHESSEYDEIGSAVASSLLHELHHLLTNFIGFVLMRSHRRYDQTTTKIDLPVGELAALEEGNNCEVMLRSVRKRLGKMVLNLGLGEQAARLFCLSDMRISDTVELMCPKYADACVSIYLASVLFDLSSLPLIPTDVESCNAIVKLIVSMNPDMLPAVVLDSGLNHYDFNLVLEHLSLCTMTETVAFAQTVLNVALGNRGAARASLSHGSEVSFLQLLPKYLRLFAPLSLPEASDPDQSDAVVTSTPSQPPQTSSGMVGSDVLLSLLLESFPIGVVTLLASSPSVRPTEIVQAITGDPLLQSVESSLHLSLIYLLKTLLPPTGGAATSALLREEAEQLLYRTLWQRILGNRAAAAPPGDNPLVPGRYRASSNANASLVTSIPVYGPLAEWIEYLPPFVHQPFWQDTDDSVSEISEATTPAKVAGEIDGVVSKENDKEKEPLSLTRTMDIESIDCLRRLIALVSVGGVSIAPQQLAVDLSTSVDFAGRLLLETVCRILRGNIVEAVTTILPAYPYAAMHCAKHLHGHLGPEMQVPMWRAFLWCLWEQTQQKKESEMQNGEHLTSVSVYAEVADDVLRLTSHDLEPEQFLGIIPDEADARFILPFVEECWKVHQVAHVEMLLQRELGRVLDLEREG